MSRSFVPALGFRWLTPLYDLLLALTLREGQFKRRLVAQASIPRGAHVLDLGCGTGTLTAMITQAHQEAVVVGLDADADILAIARSKADRAGRQARLVQASATALPFRGGAFDRVLSSLVFHHLQPEDKLAALREARRALRAVGELHVADWGRAESVAMRIAFVGVQLLDGVTNTRDHVQRGLDPFVRDAGFADVAETARQSPVFGTLALYRAVRPGL